MESSFAYVQEVRPRYEDPPVNEIQSRAENDICTPRQYSYQEGQDDYCGVLSKKTVSL